jgi:hypothetical protein
MLMDKIVIFIFPLLITNVIGATLHQPYREFGEFTQDFTLYITMFLFLYFLVQDRGIGQSYRNIYLGFILLAGIYLFSHLYNKNFAQNKELFVLFQILIYIFTLMKINWTSIHLRFIGHISNIIIIMFFLHWVNQNFIFKRYEGIFSNPNVFAVFLFSILYFQIVNIKSKTSFNRIYFTLGSILNVLLIFMTNSRTVLLSIIVIFVSFSILKYSKVFSKLFFILLSGNFVFFSIYVFLAKSSIADTINKISYKFTNKYFFSGREVIWREVVDYGITSPLIGHKVGIGVQEYIPNAHYYHVHNQYLQIFIESGLLGLLCFILLLFLIWNQYLNNLHSHYVKWSACFFLGLLVYQNTEMSLFFNLLTIGLIQWLIISIGVSMSINEHNPDISQNTSRRRYRASSRL